MFYKILKNISLTEEYKPVDKILDPEFYNFVMEKEKEKPLINDILNSFEFPQDYKIIYSIPASNSVLGTVKKMEFDFKALRREGADWQATSALLVNGSGKYSSNEFYLLLSNFDKCFKVWNLRYNASWAEDERERAKSFLISRGIVTEDELENDIIPNTQDVINTRIRLYRIIQEYQNEFAQLPAKQEEPVQPVEPKKPAKTLIGLEDFLRREQELERIKQANKPITFEEYIKRLAEENAVKVKTTDIEKAINKDAIANLITKNVTIYSPKNSNSRAIQILMTKFENKLPSNLETKHADLSDILNSVQNSRLYLDTFITKIEELDAEKTSSKEIKDAEKENERREAHFKKKYDVIIDDNGKLVHSDYTTVPDNIDKDELTKWLQKHVTRIDVKIPDPGALENASQRKVSQRSADIARFEIDKLKAIGKADFDYEPATVSGSWGSSWLIGLDSKADRDIPDGVREWKTQKRRAGFAGTTQAGAELADNEQYVLDNVFRVNKNVNGDNVYQITGNAVVRDLLVHCPGLRLGNNKKR